MYISCCLQVLSWGQNLMEVDSITAGLGREAGRVALTGLCGEELQEGGSQAAQLSCNK